MKCIRLKDVVSIATVALTLSVSMGAQAAIPGNCAQDSKKLRELASQARQLPQGFDQDIFGQWKHATRIMGHDVNIRVGKYKNGQFKIGLKVKGWAENFEEEQPLIICTTNKSAFEVHAFLNGKNQNVEVEVKQKNKIELLNGKLSGLYIKTK